MKLFALLIINSFFFGSIYTYQFTDAEGTVVNMNTFQGKKILLVNIATGSGRISQLAGLQQLHQQYGDSLVIIAFPSNSFGKEQREDAAIKEFCQANYGVSFRIASKKPVTGAQIQPIYNWLNQAGENGVMNGAVIGDFQKFLISAEGQIIGVFAPAVSPLDTQLINAIIN